MLCIEPMSAQTVREVAELEQACFSRPWSLTALTQELVNPLAVFCVAVQDARVAGYIGMHHILDEGYITNVAVSPQYRRQGVAKALVGHLLAYGEKNGLAFITLEVRPGNTSAIQLYRSLGFEEVGLRKNYYAAPTEDALLMTHYYSRLT